MNKRYKYRSIYSLDVNNLYDKVLNVFINKTCYSERRYFNLSNIPLKVVDRNNQQMVVYFNYDNKPVPDALKQKGKGLYIVDIYKIDKQVYEDTKLTESNLGSGPIKRVDIPLTREINPNESKLASYFTNEIKKEMALRKNNSDFLTNTPSLIKYTLSSNNENGILHKYFVSCQFVSMDKFNGNELTIYDEATDLVISKDIDNFVVHKYSANNTQREVYGGRIDSKPYTGTGSYINVKLYPAKNRYGDEKTWFLHFGNNVNRITPEKESDCHEDYTYFDITYTTYNDLTMENSIENKVIMINDSNPDYKTQLAEFNINNSDAREDANYYDNEIKRIKAENLLKAEKIKAEEHDKHRKEKKQDEAWEQVKRIVGMVGSFLVIVGSILSGIGVIYKMIIKHTAGAK